MASAGEGFKWVRISPSSIALAIAAAAISVTTTLLSASALRWRSRRLASRVRELESSLAAALEKGAAERRGRVRAQQALRKALAEQSYDGSSVASPSPSPPLSSYPMVPIGTVQSCFSTRNGTPRQPLLVPLARACLVFDQARVPPGALEGLADYSHCWIIYVFHLNTDLEKLWKEPSRSKFKAKVRVPRLKGGKMGVLATRSPHRPCPIGLTVAKVEALDGHAVLLSGVDLVDGTPVLDIKPYLPYSDCIQGARIPLWLKILATAEELERNKRQSSHRGSVPGHTIVSRNRVEGHERLFRDYFADPPIYPSNLFRRRFRMNRPLFLRIVSEVEAFDPYFKQKLDAVGAISLSPLQKITAAIRMLAYGVAADSVDDYVRIGESTAIESLKRFVKAIVAIYSDVYLRSPNSDDIARLLAVGEQHGFPGMLGSIDCMHWKWKNCPTAWHGMYSGHYHEPTIILEAIASYDLWIWHSFFGLPGSHNDINVLERSFLFRELTEGRAPPVNYSINGHDYRMGYYLADGIYPSWSTFVKTIPSPQGNKKKFFAAAQESARKDVERAFGVLQARFAIVRGPARFWKRETLKDIMKACIIMHNMIIEDEREENTADFNYDTSDDTNFSEVSHAHTNELHEFIQSHHRIRNRETHSQLQADLVEHLWQLHGGE